MEQKIVFLSFADSRMTTAANRLRQQAHAMQIFSEIHILNEFDLDEEFSNAWRHLLNPQVRGFGFWLWKPHIIRTQLEKLQENDILIYCDAGCHLNPKGINKLKAYIAELEESTLGVKAFPVYTALTDSLEKRWTKGDIFSYFNCRNNNIITETSQIAATQIYIKKCKKALDFVTEWETTCCQNPELINDTPSKASNSILFLDNRHDQSLFSVLYKLRGGVPFPSGETDLPQNEQSEKFPIWNSRDRGIKDKRFFARLKRFFKAKIIKLKLKIQPVKLRILAMISQGKKTF